MATRHDVLDYVTNFWMVAIAVANVRIVVTIDYRMRQLIEV